jgi:hypothetical protein
MVELAVELEEGVAELVSQRVHDLLVLRLYAPSRWESAAMRKDRADEQQSTREGRGSGDLPAAWAARWRQGGS